MKNKFLLTALLVAAFTFATPAIANAAEAETGTWRQDAIGWWFELTSGGYVQDTFGRVDGKVYYFKADGYMATGWQKVDGAWYYFDNSGAMMTGWQQIDGKWYYFWEDGSMAQNGIYEIDGKEQVFGPSGQWVSGWTWDSYKWDDGYTSYGWYYANADGTPYDGWLAYNGSWYYIRDCRMLEDDVVYDNGNRYLFRSDGVMVTGWYQYGNTVSDWYYCNADGTAYDGWLAYNGSWYYIENGWMDSSDWIRSEVDSSVQYYVGRDGKMVTGWYDVSGVSATGKSSAWIYTNADGSNYTGWVAGKGGKWYYISDSHMVADDALKTVNLKDFKKADGTYDWDAYDKAYNEAPLYIFDGTGAMVTGWYHEVVTRGGQTTYDVWYYADADGKGHDGWLKYKNAWYYIKQGRMLTNCYTPDGYWVGMDGVWR